MDDWRKYLDPEEMTPDEIYERVVELLAAGLIRLVTEEEALEQTKLATGVGTEKAEDTPATTLIQSQTKLIVESIVRGRIPFGQQSGSIGRESHEAEAFWLRRIQELSGKGFASDKIAKQLNQEDHESKRAGKLSRTAVWRILKRLKEKGVTE